MNRQIKFRAWADEMIRYDVTGFEHGSDNRMEGIFLDGDYYNMLDNPVMQFTGLKDCNGVEIYEGDIVQSQHTMASIVQWHEEYASFQFGVGCDLSEYSYIYLDDAWEIIGNIHENPELLRLIED